MKLSQLLLSAILILVTGLILYWVYGVIFRQSKNSQVLTQHGTRIMADVISISQINSKKSNVTQLLIEVELKSEEGHVRRVEIRQPVDHGAIPRVGDRVYVLKDPKDSNNVVLAPVPPGSVSGH